MDEQEIVKNVVLREFSIERKRFPNGSSFPVVSFSHHKVRDRYKTKEGYFISLLNNSGVLETDNETYDVSVVEKDVKDFHPNYYHSRGNTFTITRR